MALMPIHRMPEPRRDEDCVTRPEDVLSVNERDNLSEDPRIQLAPYIEWLSVRDLSRLAYLRWAIARGYVTD